MHLLTVVIISPPKLSYHIRHLFTDVLWDQENQHCMYRDTLSNCLYENLFSTNRELIFLPPFDKLDDSFNQVHEAITSVNSNQCGKAQVLVRKSFSINIQGIANLNFNINMCIRTKKDT
jgi:hypothetical protein